RGCQVPYELVIDPHVVQGARNGSTPGANHKAKQRTQKEHPDEQTRETAPDCLAGGRVEGLMQLDLAFAVFDCDHRLFDVDQILALPLPQAQPNLLGFELILKSHYDERSPGCLCYTSALVNRATIS